MKTENTPGPWYIWHEHPANIGHVEPSGYNLWQLVPIATPCGTIRLLAEGDTLRARQANARLIAAAPETAAERDRLRGEVRELREALEAITTQAATTSKTFPNAPGRGDWLNVERIARAALAKTNPKA